MKNKLYYTLTDLRNYKFMPKFIVDFIDDIRYSDFFSEMWGNEY